MNKKWFNASAWTERVRLRSEEGDFLPRRYCSWCLYTQPEVQLQRETGVLTCEVCLDPNFEDCFDLVFGDALKRYAHNCPDEVFKGLLADLSHAGITEQYVQSCSYDPVNYTHLLRMMSSTLMTWDGSSMSPELASHLDCFAYLKKPASHTSKV